MMMTVMMTVMMNDDDDEYCSAHFLALLMTFILASIVKLEEVPFGAALELEDEEEEEDDEVDPFEGRVEEGESKEANSASNSASPVEIDLLAAALVTGLLFEVVAVDVVGLEGVDLTVVAAAFVVATTAGLAETNPLVDGGAGGGDGEDISREANRSSSSLSVVVVDGLEETAAALGVALATVAALVVAFETDALAAPVFVEGGGGGGGEGAGASNEAKRASISLSSPLSVEVVEGFEVALAMVALVGLALGVVIVVVTALVTGVAFTADLVDGAGGGGGAGEGSSREARRSSSSLSSVTTGAAFFVAEDTGAEGLALAAVVAGAGGGEGVAGALEEGVEIDLVTPAGLEVHQSSRVE